MTRRRSRAGCSRGTALTTVSLYTYGFVDTIDLLMPVEVLGLQQAFLRVVQGMRAFTNLLY